VSLCSNFECSHNVQGAGQHSLLHPLQDITRLLLLFLSLFLNLLLSLLLLLLVVVVVVVVVVLIYCFGFKEFGHKHGSRR